MTSSDFSETFKECGLELSINNRILSHIKWVKLVQMPPQDYFGKKNKKFFFCTSLRIV